MEIENLIQTLRNGYVCNNCLGRSCAGLLSGYTNEERGKVLRTYVAFLMDSGKKIELDTSNLDGIKFRNSKIDIKKQEPCIVCNNFFAGKIDELARKIAKKIEKIEFDTFVIGSIPSNEMLNSEEKMQELSGIEFSEPMKTEINRELGKRVEILSKRKAGIKNPDLTIVVDLEANSIKVHVKSVYISGKYQKMARGIPQTKWVCRNCNGKGCTNCKGIGKLYKTSIQEIIEKPLLKAFDSKNSSFHGAGREDIDARNLGWRPFVIELLKPMKRKADLKSMMKRVNGSKINVKDLKFVEKNVVRNLKAEKIDKTYFVDVEFAKKIDKKLLKNLKVITREPIMQKTPLRVVHRRADIMRKRFVKSFAYRVKGPKNMTFTVRGEGGLYIKELINGDEGRTKPNVSDLIGNKVKKLSLDVIKIHSD